MKSLNKKFSKKVWKIIIIAFTINLVILFGITIIIYDSCFVRYEAEQADIPSQLMHLVDKRQGISFKCGSNTLAGYLYGDGNSEGIVIVAPGFNASMDNYLWQIQSFTDYGWDVFSFDSTGSCMSEGESAVGFSQEILDLDAALTYIENNYEYDNIFIFGHSRGGYAACGLLESDHNIKAVVSVAGINSAMEAIIEPVANHIGFLAYGNYPFLYLYQTILFGKNIVDIEAAEVISESMVPTMIIQGSNDSVAPADTSSIYAHKDEITSVYVEYYLCDTPGQDGHTDLLFDNDGTANDTLMNIINQFYSKNTAVSN